MLAIRTPDPGSEQKAIVPVMLRFALASLGPIAVLVAACILGGVWPLAALLYVTAFVMVMDRLPVAPLPACDTARSERVGLVLNIGLAVLHVPLLLLGVWAVAVGPELGIGQRLMLGLALGLYLGQVANSNAHELIHARENWPRRLGKTVFIALLFGHHASAHPKVHHVHVATDDDPNSARAGEGFYRFWPRAWIGSFRAGWAAENAARTRKAPVPGMLSHPYLAYCGGAFAMLFAGYRLAGARGVWVLLAVAGYAQMQLLLADYVQHYGLRRGLLPDGRRESAGPQHSWNAPHWYSGAMMLNAPRHSDHHQHPARRFAALELDAATMPMLPRPLPMMAALALIPPLWRRIIDPLLTRWQTAAPLE